MQSSVLVFFIYFILFIYYFFYFLRGKMSVAFTLQKLPTFFFGKNGSVSFIIYIVRLDN